MTKPDTHTRRSRWIGSRIDLFACLFSTSLALYLTYFSDMSAANTGFSLTVASKSTSCRLLMKLGSDTGAKAAFSAVINQAIRIFNEFEISGTGVILNCGVAQY